MPHIWKKAIEAPGSLTFEESFQLGEWTTAAFTARQNEFHQYRNGLLDREIWLGSENIIRLLVGLEWIRNWWQEHGRNDRSAEFVELVDRLISKNTRDVVSELDKALKPQQEKAGNPDQPGTCIPVTRSPGNPVRARLDSGTGAGHVCRAA
jgi:hypothetical protein